MRVLVTGGNGFLGSNLVRCLLRQGHDICVLSRSKDRINDILDRILFVQLTEDSSVVKKSVLDFVPDVVIDCAWSGGNSYKDINNLDQFYSNLPRGLCLLETLALLKTKPHYMGFGSFAEYGAIDKRAIETQVEKPQSFYGLSKMSMKNISKMYCEHHDISWSWVRPCYVYGPRDVPTRLIPMAIRSLLMNRDLILNSCRSTVDYLYIDDFSMAISALLDDKKTGVFNICSGNEYPLIEVLTHIQAELGSSRIVYDSSLDRDKSYRYICGSNDKLKTETQWKPSVDIKQGILNTIAYECELMELPHKTESTFLFKSY